MPNRAQDVRQNKMCNKTKIPQRWLQICKTSTTMAKITNWNTLGKEGVYALQIQNNQLLCIIYFNLCVHLKASIIFTDADNCDLVEHMCVWSVHTLRTAKVEDTHSNGPWKHWALSSSTSACVLWIIIIVMYFFVEFFFWRLIFSFFLFVLLLFTYRNWTLFNSQRFNAQLNCLNSALIAIFLFLFRSCPLSPHTVEMSDNCFFEV